MSGQICIFLALIIMGTSSCEKGLDTNPLSNKELVGKTFNASVGLKSPVTGRFSTVYYTLQFISRTEVLSSIRIRKDLDTDTNESLKWEIDGIDERGIIVYFKDDSGVAAPVAGSITNIGLKFNGDEKFYKLLKY